MGPVSRQPAPTGRPGDDDRGRTITSTAALGPFAVWAMSVRRPGCSVGARRTEARTLPSLFDVTTYEPPEPSDHDRVTTVLAGKPAPPMPRRPPTATRSAAVASDAAEYSPAP